MRSLKLTGFQQDIAHLLDIPPSWSIGALELNTQKA